MAPKCMNHEKLILIPSTDSDGCQQSINGVDGANKVPRLPRWTKQEIFVLIQEKKVIENQIHQVRTGGLKLDSTQVESKWDSVSSYCKRQRVNRGPVQCQKRWSYLDGNFKKIKERESQIIDETESFWTMMSDFKKEKKLPGFFDRQVFDILDHENVVVGDDELFTDLPPMSETPIPMLISGQQPQPLSIVSPTQAGTRKPTTRGPDIGRGQEERKRKRNDSHTSDQKARNVQHDLLRALERSGKMVSSQLEAQNMHFEKDREQRRDHVDNVVIVLNKLADSLGRIADKL